MRIFTQPGARTDGFDREAHLYVSCAELITGEIRMGGEMLLEVIHVGHQLLVDEAVTQTLTLKTLGVLSIADHNPLRSIKNTEWLMTRPGGIIKIDPSQISKAENFVKKFCTKKWKDDATNV